MLSLKIACFQYYDVLFKCCAKGWMGHILIHLFMRKNEIFRQASDYSVVDKTDIIVKLPPPKIIGETS